MNIESTIRQKVIEILSDATSDPVYEFGSSSDEKTGAQFVVQCDRPSPAEDGRTRAGRAAELTYVLIIHAIIHSQKQREDVEKTMSMTIIADSVITQITTETVTDWLNGSGQCTGIYEQEGSYNFSESFDDFVTTAELYIMQTQES